MREGTLGGLMVLVAATGLGTLAIFGKVAEAADLSRPTLLFFRFAFAALLVWVASLVRNDMRILSGRPLYATVFLGVLYGLLTLSFFRGLTSMTASLTAIVFYTYPIFVFGLSVPILDEQLNRISLSALGLALWGVVMVIGIDASQVSLLGIGLVTAAAAMNGIYNVGGRILTADTDPTQLTAHVLVVAALTIGVRWGMAGFQPPQTATHWAIILGIGVLGTAVPLLLLYQGLERIEATHASILGTAEPVATVLLGVTILDETLTIRTIVGGILILGGVTLVQTSSEQRKWALGKVGLH